jgi:hypothetical protein
MALEPIPFFTGKQVSTADPVTIPPGTDPAAFTSDQQNAKTRVWRLETAGDAGAANLPANPYRARVVVDATECTDDATVFYGSDITGNTLVTTRHQAVPTTALWEMPAPIWKGAMQVGLNGTTTSATPVIVTEFSYV